MFVGRHFELEKLNQLFIKKQSQLVVMYGRRRIGKSTLVENFSKNKKFIRFEGLENGHTKEQIANFHSDLCKQIDDPHLKLLKFAD